MPWDFTLILAALAIIVPWRGTVRIRALLVRPTVTSQERLTLYASTIALQWTVALIIFWRCAAHHYSRLQLGLCLDRPALAAAVGLGMAALLVSNQIISVRRLRLIPVNKRGAIAEIARKLMPHAREEVLAYVALVTTVAVCEEFIYRGFVQGTFQKAVPEAVGIGIVVSALFFAAAHLYQGAKGLGVTFILGILFAAGRSWTGSILPSIIAHFAADLAGGLAASHWLMDDTRGDERKRF